MNQDLRAKIANETLKIIEQGFYISPSGKPIDISSDITNSRSTKILNLAIDLDYKRLVLGAWGCGVFKNSPQDVAAIFHQHLTGTFANHFKEIVFAVLDRSEKQETFKSFKQKFV